MMLGVTPIGQAVQAHGKELSLEVSSFTPDSQEPLGRLYRVLVVFTGDREPVEEAKVMLSAERQGGGPPMEPVLLEPLNEPGLYAAQVAFPMFGSWNVTLRVEELGDGEVSFVESVVPIGPTTNTDEVRQQVLDLFFSFNWRDVAAIGVRISHTLAGIVWFGMTAVILVAYWFLPPVSRPPVFQRLSSFFFPAAVFSLFLLAASGVYSAIYSAPIKPPGVFDLDVMLRIPFGPHYVATIVFKAFVLGVSGVLTVRMAKALRLASLSIVTGGSTSIVERKSDVVEEASVATKDSPLFRLTIANVVIGLSLAVAIVLAIYIPTISHLAAFLPN